MGSRTIAYCDYCKEEFEHPASYKERYTLNFEGDRYTDAAGSRDSNSFQLEMHKACWASFITSLHAFLDESN